MLLINIIILDDRLAWDLLVSACVRIRHPLAYSRLTCVACGLGPCATCVACV